ncbi:hypothetical protein EMIT0158MI4_150234 [Burkholderia ambifaria]
MSAAWMNFTKIPLFHDEGAMSTGIVRDRTPGTAARRQRVGMVPESGCRPGTPTTAMFVAPRHSPRGHTGGSAKLLSLPGNGFAWRRSASSSLSFRANNATPITPTFAVSPYFEFVMPRHVTRPRREGR